MKQEEDYRNRIAVLEKKSQEGGVVARNKAANEVLRFQKQPSLGFQLAQLKAEDPLPLRRAKLNQEAAAKKSEKATAKAKADEEAAEAAAQKAEVFPNASFF